MTPQERALVTELFDRLARLEAAPRDRDALGAIDEGLRRAPNAIYALVQTVLLQDEALKAADARIRDLEAGGQAQEEHRGFLDTMRDQWFGRREGGSVPSVPPAGAGTAAGASPWAPLQGRPSQWSSAPMATPSGAAVPQEPERGSFAGTFLGTAAATAAGAIGGALLLNSIRSAFGSHTQGQGPFGGALERPGGPEPAPWSGGGGHGGDLSRQAGIDDIGHGRRHGAYDSQGEATSRDDAFGDERNDANDLGDGDFDSDVEDSGFDGGDIGEA